MAHILILAALPEEADALFPDGGTREDGIFAARRLAAHGHALTVATCGLGKVHAALAAGMLGTDADLLLMSGTCGALDAEAGRAHWLAAGGPPDCGTVRPARFDRYCAGAWPAGEVGIGGAPWRDRVWENGLNS